MSIYDLSVQAADGHEIPLSDYRGKVLLIVNTATGCGFTPHYEPIEKMYEKYIRLFYHFPFLHRGLDWLIGKREAPIPTLPNPLANRMMSTKTICLEKH